jgi:hypothetical protein
MLGGVGRWDILGMLAAEKENRVSRRRSPINYARLIDD